MANLEPKTTLESDYDLVDRIQRLVPKLWIGRSTKLLIWWFDSVNGWDSSVD